MGEAQIDKLASANLTDEQFDEAFANLTRTMTRMNRFAARRAEQAPDEQQEALGRIVESAMAAGLPVVQAFTEAFSAQVAPDALANLQTLINMFTPQVESAAQPSDEPALPSPTEKSSYDEEEIDEFE